MTEHATATNAEPEEVRDARVRIALAGQLRWAVLGLLALWLLLSAILALATGHWARVPPVAGPAIGSLAFAALYNLVYRLIATWLPRIRYLHHGQIFFDLLVVSVFVRVSGAAAGWLWGLYLLPTLEAALLLGRRRDALAVAALGCAVFGLLILAEGLGAAEPLPVPVGSGVAPGPAQTTLVWLWLLAANAGIGVAAADLLRRSREREAALRRSLTEDALTGLPNRAHFNDHLELAVTGCRRFGDPISLLVVDVDHFRAYNERWGHAAGDRAIKRIAEIVVAQAGGARAGEGLDLELPARYGGEQFAVLLPEIGAEVEKGGQADPTDDDEVDEHTARALALAERIRRAIEAAEFDGHRLTVSLGVATYGIHGESAADLARAAEGALGAAKRQGRNRVALPPPESEAGV
jgi:GGDEF domain-containing protein